MWNSVKTEHSMKGTKRSHSTLCNIACKLGHECQQQRIGTRSSTTTFLCFTCKPHSAIRHSLNTVILLSLFVLHIRSVAALNIRQLLIVPRQCGRVCAARCSFARGRVELGHWSRCVEENPRHVVLTSPLSSSVMLVLLTSRGGLGDGCLLWGK